MAVIAIEAIRVTANHGVYEAEILAGNTFIIDVYLDTSDAAAREAAATDALKDTLDYQAVYNLVLEEMNIRANLLETLACRIGNKILRTFPAVDSANIRVSKLKPLHLEACSRTYVEISFDRTTETYQRDPEQITRKLPGGAQIFE